MGSGASKKQSQKGMSKSQSKPELSSPGLQSNDGMDFRRNSHVSGSVDISVHRVSTPDQQMTQNSFYPNPLYEQLTGARDGSHSDIGDSYSQASLDKSKSKSSFKKKTGQQKKTVKMSAVITEEAEMDEDEPAQNIRFNRSKFTKQRDEPVIKDSIRGPCTNVEESYSNKIYFTDKELKKLKKKFELADTTGKGLITPQQLGNIRELISHSFKIRIIELAEDWMHAAGKSGIDFDMFAKILSVFHTKCPNETKMKYLFRLYDIDGDNTVNEKDIITMMKKIFFIKDIKELEVEGGFETLLANEAFVEQMATDIIRLFDKNGDRVLEYFEFKEMLYEGDVETRMNIAF